MSFLQSSSNEHICPFRGYRVKLNIYRLIECFFRTVLELGSGLGFTGISVCKQCNIKSMTFSDCHQQVLYLLMVNIENNFSKSTGNCAIKAVLPENQSVISKRRKMIRSIRRQLSVKQDMGMEQSDIMELSCTSATSSEDIEEDFTEDMNFDCFTPNEDFWEEGDYAETYKLSCDKKINLLQFDWIKSSYDILDSLAPDIILAAGTYFNTSQQKDYLNSKFFCK